MRQTAVRLLLCILLLAGPYRMHAQSVKDTALTEVKVHAHRKIANDTRVNDFAPGQKIRTIDSTTLQQYQLQNMANLLSQQVPVFVKSYGVNGLASLSFRGASAAQSQVLWNGIPIQNAALGISDISTLPVLLVSNVSVIYGGSAALLGSGNVGGALLLENDAAVFDSGRHTLSLFGGAGSFSQYTGGLKGSLSNKRWYFAANIFAQSALNNFSYTDAAGNTVNMTNARLQSHEGLARAAYKISSRSTVSLTAWYQQYMRQIPPALFESYSDKKQLDGSIKLLADWNRKAENNTWYAKSSFIQDDMDFSYQAVALHWRYITRQYYQEIGWKRQLGSYGQLLIFTPFQAAWINQPDSNTSRSQTKAALAAAYNISCISNRLNIAVNARAEMITQLSDTTIKKYVFLPGADASFILTRWLSLRANVQRTYRAPTLNELYYYPGGNKYLRPEQGWSEDAGYTVKVKLGRFAIYHDLSIYNRDIHDWILWLGGAIWTPHNIAEVHSRGVETENNVTYTIGDWQLHAGVNTAYVLATTVSSYIYNDGSIGKQIPYTPRYNGQLNVGFGYKRIYFNYNHTYTGYRFTTSDESAYVLPYQTGNAQLMYHLHVHGHALQLTGQCNNLWNQQYQVVNGRPMPGLNWQLGFKVGLL